MSYLDDLGEYWGFTFEPTGPLATACAEVDLLRARETALVGLLTRAKCPDCDGQGFTVEETGGCSEDGENDTRESHQVQCQWCDERNAALHNADSSGGGEQT